jgi:hypothetical protein
VREWEGLAKSQQSAEHRLRDTLADVDVKVHQIGQQMSNALTGSRRYKELESVRMALGERRDEIKRRLAGGILSKDKVNAMHDLAEEAETLQAEIDLNRVRLAEEERKVAKGGGGKQQQQQQVGSDPQQQEVAMLVAELRKRRAALALAPSMAATLSAEEEEQVCRALARLAALAVDARYKLAQTQSTVQDLRCHLDETESTAQEWQEAAQRGKIEASRRLQETKAASEKRVEALLKQVRKLESRNLETSQRLRLSVEGGGGGDYSNASANAPANVVNVNVSSGSAGGMGLVPEVYQSYDHGGGGGGLAPPSGSSSPQSVMRRRSDHDLSRDLASSIESFGSTGYKNGNGNHNNSDGSNHSSNAHAQAQAQAHMAAAESEVLERWQNEKERRTALEKRNAELIRELRGARSSIEQPQQQQQQQQQPRYQHK